jgi:predicted GIY-YIG superfamily endonuclease
MSDPSYLKSKPTTVYRLFDAKDVLLYVGVSVDVDQRWRVHRSSSPWWRLVARKSVVEYPDRDLALAAEAAAIQTEKPLYNRDGVPAELRRSPEMYSADPLQVYITQEERRALRVKAAQAGLSMSAYVRQMIQQDGDEVLDGGSRD